MKNISVMISIFISFILHADTEYIPIVLVHGILSDKYGMAPAVTHIRKYMGENVYIKNVNVGDGEFTSLTTIINQGEYLRKTIQTDPLLKNGFNFIVHSQGGLVSRYYLQKYNNPPVLNYISWGSPHQGVYGLPGDYDNRFRWLDYIESYAHNFIYSWFMQTTIGFAGYWHDTLHNENYLSHSVLLPYLNNEIDHPQATFFKANICNLKNMVLVMSEIDDVIEPRESCHFGFYQVGSKTEIQKIFDTDIYKNDALGLKTLYDSGRLYLLYAHCTHTEFQADEQNFVENTLPYLLTPTAGIPSQNSVQSSTVIN